MNSFGRFFRFSLWGESHGPEIGVVIDGVPAGLPLAAKDFRRDLARRRTGAPGTSTRREPDVPRLVSGIFRGKTSGAPLAVLFENRDARSGDYAGLERRPRPGHADFTAGKKFSGCNDPRGGGHFSGRLTLALVAAGVVAKRVIAPAAVSARLSEIGGVRLTPGRGRRAALARLAAVAAAGDSLGAIIACRGRGLPVGLGEPFFDALESLVAHLVLAVPGVRGIEFGAGFSAAAMTGSEHNDPIVDGAGRTASNHAGGVCGGISNGNELLFRVAAKPTASIGREQDTIDLRSGRRVRIRVRGRHDACFALRLPVVIEAAGAVVIADLMLLDQQRRRVPSGIRREK